MEELELDPLDPLEKNQLYFAIIRILKLDCSDRDKAMEICKFVIELTEHPIETIDQISPTGGKSSPIFRRVG